MRKNIDKLVKKIIRESLEGKAGELENKISMDEWTPQEPLTLSGVGVTDEDETDDYVMDKIKRECDENPSSESCLKHKKYAGMGGSDELDEISTKDLVKGKKYKMKTPSGFEDEVEHDSVMDYPGGRKTMYGFKGKKAHHAMGDTHIEDYLSDIDEELIGGQKKLDKNKNGRLDKQDFKMLRKKSVEEQGHTAMTDEPTQWDDNEFETRYGKGPEEIDISDEGEMGRGNNIEDIEFEDMPRKKSDSFFSKMKNKLGLGEDEEEVEEGNAFTGALAKTKKGDKFNLGGKSYTDRSNLEEAEKFIQKAVKKMDKKGTEGSFKEYCGGEVTKSCIDKAMKSGDPKLVKKANFAKNIKAYHGAEHKKKSVKESLQLTESEMIDLIEKIVMEQKKAKGMAETEKVLSANKKENEDAIKAVTKKMKEYLKDGSKGEYSMEPKIFPKGNGELAKMDKMAYKANKPTEEYIDNFTAAGLENLVYDEIQPDEKWVDDNIEGSSRTGNNPEWANAVDNGVNKKRNKIRKDNLLGAVKAMAYNKAPQPVTDDTKSGPAGKFNRNFGKDAGKKATKILNQLESKEDKSEKLISEEFDKIKHLMGYNKNTQ